jgi:cystathionine beta-synthase
MWYRNILEVVGNTPLIRLNAVAAHLKPTVLVKVEYFNPGNSVKDRIALQMVSDAERQGRLLPGGTIIEGTSGNTGMGLALVAAVKGYRCIFTVTDKQSQEKIDILRAVGAEVIVCPTNVPPEDPRSYYSVAKRLSQEIPNSFYPNQYDNPSNAEAHYRTTGPEIWRQTDGLITHFAAGMGTCGTLCGTGRYLKEMKPTIQCIGIDTYGSLFQKYFETGKIDPNEIYPYLTEGIGEDIVPENYNPAYIDRIIKVTDRDAALMTRKLARLEGLFVGWSCGSAVHGALEYARQLQRDDVLVVVLPDHGTRYLNKIYNDNWMRERGYLGEGSLMTAFDILKRKPEPRRFLTVQAEHTLGEAIQVMRTHDISQLPVLANGAIVGSVNESRLLSAMIDDPSMRDAPVSQVIDDPFPYVLPSTRIDTITKMINQTNPAVLVQTESGEMEIITKSDLLQVLMGDGPIL